MNTTIVLVPWEQLLFDRRQELRWTPQDIESNVFPLYNTSSPDLNSEQILYGLSQIRKTYGNEGVDTVLRWIAEEDPGSISDSRKSTIFGLAHSLMYANNEPSVCLILALHFAIRSWDEKMITNMKSWILSELAPSAIKWLVEVFWGDLVESGVFWTDDIRLIQTQLNASQQVQLTLNLEPAGEADLVH